MTETERQPFGATYLDRSQSFRNKLLSYHRHHTPKMLYASYIPMTFALCSGLPTDQVR